MPDGPLNVFVWPAAMGGLRFVMPQAGSGLTVRITSSLLKLLVHRPASRTVKRKTAVPGPLVRITVVAKLVHPAPQEVAPVIRAGPEKTLHARFVIGFSP